MPPLVSAVNLGGLLLQALLEFWPRTRINPMDEEENEVNHGKDLVEVEVGGWGWVRAPPVVDRRLLQSRLFSCARQSTGSRRTGSRRGTGTSRCRLTRR